MSNPPPPEPGEADGASVNLLGRRAGRPADPEQRARVFAYLARQLTASNPQQQLQHIAAAVRELCGADSVGYSHARKSDSAEIFCWQEGACPPTCPTDAAIELPSRPSAAAGDEVFLCSEPLRECPELAAAAPTICEALVAPLQVEGQWAGGLWAIGHGAERRFDAEDGRSLLALAHFAGAAYQARERERANDELQRSREQDYELFEHARLAMRWVAPDGTILWANRTELDLLGYEHDEYVGRHIGDFHADPQALSDIVAALREGRPVYDYPVRLIHKDGTQLDVEVSSNAFWRDGEFVHTRCFTRDVTERRKGEHARARLAAIVTSSDDAIVSKDLDGRITSWNRGAARLFGYTADEAIGRPITMLMPPDRVDEEASILRRIRAGARVEHFETLRQRRDGSVLDISLTVSPIFDDRGRIVGASKIARDITERKRNERLLSRTRAESERQKRFYEAIISSTPDLVWAVDRDYRFIVANEAVLRMWGRTLDEVAGKTLTEVGYEPWRADQRIRLFDRVVASKHAVRSEASYPHATLGERIYDFIVSPVLDEHGEVEAVVGTTRDITDRKRVEQDLRDSQRRLTELNRSLEQRVQQRTELLEQRTGRLRELAAELSTAEQRERKRLAAMLHDELQQLLVAAQIQLGRTHGRVDDEATARSIERAERLLEETMAASRNLTRQLRPPVLYEDGLVSALKCLAGDIEERYLVSVSVATHDDVPALGDDFGAFLFESARELLLNVAKHAETDRAMVNVWRDEGMLRLAVEDRGCGFVVDARTAAADRLRLDGFGLFSIRERLTALGGSVAVDSTPGRGTRVELAVPVEAATAEPAEASPPAETAPLDGVSGTGGRAVRILVADDHALVRQGIAHVLRGHERVAEITEAGDGIEALEAMQQQRPDVVLMDVNMPRMNGIEATREAAQRWPDTITIGLSVQNDEYTAELMREAGAVGFLPKSGDSGQMIAKLLALVDAPSANAEEAKG